LVHEEIGEILVQQRRAPGDEHSFLVDRPYLQVWRYPDEMHRQGIEMTFHTEAPPDRVLRAGARRRGTRDRSDQGADA
jgi:hypothetical protein